MGKFKASLTNCDEATHIAHMAEIVTRLYNLNRNRGLGTALLDVAKAYGLTKEDCSKVLTLIGPVTRRM